MENNTTRVYYNETDSEGILLKNIPSSELESLTDNLMESNKTQFWIEDENKVRRPYYFTKLVEGMTAGYRETDLTYAGDLIANVGETITSVLDKIKNMLVQFEYFYNLEGQFVFQKK
jgi:hypothetical protein